MKGLLVSVIVTLALSGCTYASKQVLGENATPINPKKALVLPTKKIFRVRDKNKIYEICKEDQSNRAMKAISVDSSENSDDTISDKIAGEDITIDFPGIPSLQMPYSKTRVEGYSVHKASWPSDDDFYSYVRKSVGPNCRKLIDQGNVLIVESEARAKKSFQAYKGPLKDLPIGALKLKGLGSEYVVRGPSNVTFGVIAASK